jgi:putative endonuclease
MKTFSDKKSLGNWGEQVATKYLADQGYRLVVSNYRCRYGEVDLICKEGDAWCFVEVKTRRSSSFGSGLDGVTSVKQKRMIHSALHYLNEASLFEVEARFDVVSIDFIFGDDYRITLIKNAFSL